MENRTTFIASCNGDPSVGIAGQQAEVLVWVDLKDAEQVAFVKEQLKTAFSAIWDERVWVVTAQECRDDDSDEA